MSTPPVAPTPTGVGDRLRRLRRRWEEAGQKAQRDRTRVPERASVGVGPDAFVHPRVAERLAEVAAERSRRRRRRAVAGLAILSGLGVGGLLVLHSSLLGLRTLRIQGASGPEAAAVVAASGIRRGEPLVDISPGAVRARVDRLADVRSVAVERNWPHTVVLAVRRHHPVAVLVQGGRAEEVDRAGRVIELVSAPPEGLPVLRGVRAVRVGQVLPGDRARQAIEIAAAVANELPAQVARQARPVVGVASGSGRVGLVVDGTVHVRLGGVQDLAAKIRALAVLLARVPLAHVSQVDLSDPELPALTPTGPKP